MTSTLDDLSQHTQPRRQALALVLALAVCGPGVALRVSGAGVNEPALAAVIYGAAIVGSAFVLSWAAEAAQLDISAGLAIAVLALIAVLPEYAVDLVFAHRGGAAFKRFGPACRSAADAAHRVESSCSLALANMTGSNRLLIGLGWSLVVFVAWLRLRRRRPNHPAPARGHGERPGSIVLGREHAIELAFLAAATGYSLVLPFKRSITLVDTAVLLAIFVLYTVRLARAPAEEPHLVGPARWIGGFPVARRRATVIGLLLVAAGVILAVAERFAQSLVDTGSTLHISEFLLVQWLAPLASEAPELLVAGLYAWRLNTEAGLGTLVSSKVNQWTLLVGTIPAAFALAASSTHGLPMVARQREELLLTAAQSVFALAVLSNLTLSTREAMALFGLFWAQFLLGALVPESAHGTERIVVAVIYFALGAIVLTRHRRDLGRVLRDGFVTPVKQLGNEL